MCQISVVLSDGGEEKLIAEGVTELMVKGDNVEIGSLFDPTITVEGVAIAQINFLDGKVFLKKVN